MISIISCNNNGKEDAAEEEPKVGFNSAGGGDGSSGDVGLNSSGPSEEVTASHEDTVKSEEPGVPEASSEVMNESGVSEMKIEENKSGDASEVDSENQASFCIPTDSGDGEPDDKRPSPKVVDYESQLKGFDEIVAKGKGEAVGNGYEIGDLVWGKVKSHPWWPGHIYNEAFATPSVRRTKHEGHVLVAFFGDGSYGWFEPAELIPFEKNFAEKSRQTLSRSFLKAVEEAVDEVSRRRGLGLICRCRNQFNLWPTSVNGYFIAEVPGYEPNAVYSSSQIEKARSSFLPREMLAFLQQLALKPLTDEYWMLNFIKNKATVLACRKALFEEYDETYAQAFGTEFVRPVRPTAPPVIDSSKDPLSGRLVVAEALGKTKSSAKPIRMKDQIEKDRYLFKRRDDTNEFKAKKAKLDQSGSSSHPIVQDGLHIPGKLDYTGMSEHVRQVPEPGVSEGHNLPTTHQASAEGLHKEKNLEVSSGPKKLLDSATKKAKLHKRPAGESTENSVLADKKKKRKKETSNRASSVLIQTPVTVDNVGAAVERSTGTSVHVSMAENRLPTMETWQPIGKGTAEFELSVLLRDLQALALDPFHGVERRSPAIIRQVFSKFRALVYQKSLAVSAPAENDLNEAASASKPAARAPASSTENMKEVPVAVKPIKPPIRHDDPVKSGKKRGPSDRLEEIAAKKKKRLVDVKSLAAEKKAGLKAVDVPRGDVKEVAAKNVQPSPKRALKLETSKKKEQQPVKAAERTMLVMKFPPGGALPSIAELKAKFARFGPLDHSATRVFWKSYTCRLVYQYKAHAQAALRFASGSGNLFGNANVRCYLREMESEGQETEPAKAQRDDSSAGASQQPKEYAVEQRIAPKLAQQQPQSQLKSCLKKSSIDEAGGNGISGSGKSTRVKFVLGGEETQLYSSGNENTNSAIFPEGASSTNSVDLSSKNIAKIKSSSPLTSNHQFQNMRSNMPFSSEQVSGPFNASLHIVPRTNNDIAQQMINLLTKCNDVVNNLSGVLGYVPYHPL